MFGDKKEKKEDLKVKVNTWFNNLRRLQKLDILTESYSKISIEMIENIGIHTLWNKISLDRRSVIMEIYEKERSKKL